MEMVEADVTIRVQSKTGDETMDRAAGTIAFAGTPRKGDPVRVGTKRGWVSDVEWDIKNDEPDVAWLRVTITIGDRS